MATLKLSLDVVDGTSVRVSCDIVEPYVEPSILSPVKRNAVRIALTPEASSTPADVRQMFSFAGAIESFEVHEKAAIVTYESEQAANAALLLDGAATLIGSPVGVEVVLMNREEVAAAPATATPGELASPPASYAAPDAQEDEDEHLVLFSRDGPKAATKAFYAAFVADAVNAEDGEEPEEQAFYSAAVLKSMVSAGYALGERAVQYIADVDERNGYAPQRLRKSASELGAATVEALRSSAEQVRSLDAEHQISSQISSHVRSTAAKLNEKGAEVASSAMTSAKGAATSATEVAASAASAGLTTARARVAELATLPKTRETVNSTLAKAASKGGEVVSGAVAKGSAVTAKVVGDVKSAVEEVKHRTLLCSACPTQPPGCQPISPCAFVTPQPAQSRETTPVVPHSRKYAEPARAPGVCRGRWWRWCRRTCAKAPPSASRRAACSRPSRSQRGSGSSSRVRRPSSRRPPCPRPSSGSRRRSARRRRRWAASATPTR